jgi:hypothetical protein
MTVEFWILNFRCLTLGELTKFFDFSLGSFLGLLFLSEYFLCCPVGNKPHQLLRKLNRVIKAKNCGQTTRRITMKASNIKTSQSNSINLTAMLTILFAGLV